MTSPSLWRSARIAVLVVWLYVLVDALSVWDGYHLGINPSMLRLLLGARPILWLPVVPPTLWLLAAAIFAGPHPLLRWPVVTKEEFDGEHSYSVARWWGDDLVPPWGWFATRAAVLAAWVWLGFLPSLRLLALLQQRNASAPQEFFEFLLTLPPAAVVIGIGPHPLVNAPALMRLLQGLRPGRLGQDRLGLWNAATAGLWWLAALIVGLITLGDVFGVLAAGNSSAPMVPRDEALHLFGLVPLAHSFFWPWLRLWTDLGAVVPLIWLGGFGNDPRGLVQITRLRFVMLASVFIVGLPLGHLAYDMLDYGGVLAGAAWVVSLLGLFGMVPALFVAGLVTAALLILLGGLVAGLLYFLGYALPLWLFKLIDTHLIDEHIRRQKIGLLQSHIYRFAMWLRDEPLPPPPPDDSKGARFAVPQEVQAAYNPDGAAFGSYGGAPLLLETNKHVLIMASTRSGKGVSLIIPHLLRYTGSAFVLDPKGENARATVRRREHLNGICHVLDPFGISGFASSRFNPMARMTPANMEAESKALAAAFILGERDHWTASAQQLLAALILFIHASPSFPPDAKDLRMVRRLLLGALMPTLHEMQKSNLADGLIAALATSFLETPERERGSIISTAQRETEILDNPYIAHVVAASGGGRVVDFAQWREGKMTVYLCLSAPKFPVFNRWLRLVLTSALDTMTETLNPPEEPVCFMLDELATLGHMPPVENAIGLAAGYGIQIYSVFQDIAQMRDLYKSRWASFIGNSGVRAIFNLDDYDTAHYWSQFIGGHVVATHSQQLDNWGLGKGQGLGESMRPLLSADAIMINYASTPDGGGRMLVLPQGVHPIEADRVPYFRDPTLTGLWQDPREQPR